MLAIKVLSLVTYYNGTPHFAKEGKEKTLQSRQGLQRLFLHIQLCSDSLFVLVFDLCDFFRRGGDNP